MEERERLKIPKGVTDFGRLRDGGYYFVDKSELISDIVAKKAKVYLFTRPRRFGKSLNLSMIDCFFNLRYRGNRWFDGLRIMEHPGPVSRMGTRPVIRMSLSGLRVDTYDSFISDFRGALGNLSTGFEYLSESGSISRYDRAKFLDVLPTDFDETSAKDYIAALCRMLKAHHGIEPVVLIDEYDKPINDAYGKASYDSVLGFLKAFYDSTLKNNPCLGFAVVTGVMQIAKESIFSGINNMHTNSIFSDDSDERYGFTPEEVKEMCSYYGGTGAFQVAREWYDGYRFGDAEIYNPWSLINFIDSGFVPGTYWAGTGGNEIIGTLLMEADDDSFRDLQVLGNGGTVTDKDVRATVAVGDIATDPDALFSILAMSGYLNAVEDGDFYDLSVPNREMYDVFSSVIIGRCVGSPVRLFREFFDAAERNDIGKMESSAFSIFARNFQDWDLPDEGAYRRILAGAAMSRCGRYTVSSEGQSGNGRSDLLMVRNSPQVPNIVMEFKKTRVDDPEVQLADAEEGLRRIKDKECFHDLRGRTIIYGISMLDKKAKVVSEVLDLP